jgi:hypothetical protein
VKTFVLRTRQFLFTREGIFFLALLVGAIAIRIPLLLADSAAIIYLYRQTRKRHSEQFALLATASYAFLPALLYNGAIWRHREPIYLCLGLAVQAFGFFLFMGGQHERYLFLFIPLALASLIVAQRDTSRHLIALYALGTALCFLNMAVGVSSFGSSQVIPYLSLQPLSDFLSLNFDALANLIAFLHLATFVYLLWVYLARPFEPARQPRSDEEEESRPLMVVLQ